MRLRHIEVFHAIYTTGSVTNAAKKLYVSQPSISKVLTHAEQQLGFQLFNRVKGRLVPTQEAESLFEEVDRIYQQMANVDNLAHNLKNSEIGRIELAITPALGFDVVPASCVEFNRQYPNIGFNIQTLHSDQVLNHLTTLQSELAIMFAPQKFSGINQIDFGSGTLVAVYSKKLLPHCPKRISLQELIEFPMIGIGDSGPLADIVSAQMLKQALKPMSKIRVQTYFTAVSLVRYGEHICIVDEFTAASQQSDDIGIAELEGEFEFPIKLLHLDQKPLSKVAARFIDQVGQQFKSSQFS